MIFVSQSLPVNEGSEVTLRREDVWDGLLLKANNALPFVAAMTACEVVARYDDGSFDRQIELRGERMVERITLEPQHRVVFTRLDGPVLGTIANEIEETEDSGLSLRFSFALCVRGLPGGSAEERAYAEGMTKDYLQAVASTLAAMRRIAAGQSAPA